MKERIEQENAALSNQTFEIVWKMYLQNQSYYNGIW